MSEKLLEAIGNISDQMIADAAPSGKAHTGRAVPVWIKWTAAAAAFALILSVGGHTLTPGSTTATLPMLTLGEDDSMGMGFEGYMAYDISELTSGNPWTEEAHLTTLPVFENPFIYDEQTCNVTNADIRVLKDRLKETAARLGMDTDNVPILDSNDRLSEQQKQNMKEKIKVMEAEGYVFPEGAFDPSYYYMESGGIRVEMDLSLNTAVYFEPAVSLPEEYNFTHYASYDDKLHAAEYLLEEYRGLIAMENPVISISGGDYNIYGERSFNISFYDGSGSLTQQILSYNFDSVFFACDDDGKLFLARLQPQKELSRTGDYPVISVKEAKSLLLEGKYVTTCTEPVENEEYILKAELVYRTGWLPYYIPYYRFYVELPDMERENGLKTYGAYYVPAVEQQYISDMPQWDANFN